MYPTPVPAEPVALAGLLRYANSDGTAAILARLRHDHPREQVGWVWAAALKILDVEARAGEAARGLKTALAAMDGATTDATKALRVLAELDDALQPDTSWEGVWMRVEALRTDIAALRRVQLQAAATTAARHVAA